MSKEKLNPKSLSEAIEQLESATHSKVDDFKNLLEKDYQEVRRTLDGLKPHLDGLKSKIETEAKNTKGQVEERIKDNPWVTLGAIGIVAFVIGWIFGQNRKE
ncbi:MAG: hypothetical protein H7326_03325 [Bdellovibrionaceae bacterium]|nr:hypothetical protein [Pseudobdellovibrionaceae bacterium]